MLTSTYQFLQHTFTEYVLCVSPVQVVVATKMNNTFPYWEVTLSQGRLVDGQKLTIERDQ